MGLFERAAMLEPYLRSVLRIVAGLMFSLYGYQKFFGWFGGFGGTTPPLMSQLGIAGVLETFGGAMIIVGFATRPVAFLLSGQMAFAYFLGHASRGPNPLLNQGIPAILFCFLYLWLFSAGPGPWSVDRALGRK